ncbi:CDP-diacylglycerol--glycerol-3-phosphate 3-phosphatidyltransferase [Massilimicrobiota sp. An134]|uniref:CDP-diacylglycerol--glycerol-3-phosphate 3-phosphatidyltransferase n=1 Tax=Massilimicrobiota sp. An134 TaxID=1965557 RepID=UPI000B38B14A|nr:CDP-diacylglycerol--glycerol-3-phosphate 3-phosphatidyltransferase [Massilimicrobiota sp. An134]OUQ29348.1 CDP-diacylglycerol--glycerol-3-phosphate 3-phosphatidyltransferase [Massilimicrobiota sp. An134]
MNLPNKLTTIRLLSVPLFIIVYLIPYQSLGIEIPVFDVLSTSLSLLDIILFLIFALSALTDYLDGYIARKQHLITTFGKFIDPIADKLIVNTTLLLLASTHDIHIIIPIIMISRDIIVDAIRLVASQKNVVLAASYLGKAKTMTQMLAICLLLLNNIVFAGLHIPMDQIMIWLATLISFVSGVDYFMKNRQYIMESM